LLIVGLNPRDAGAENHGSPQGGEDSRVAWEGGNAAFAFLEDFILEDCHENFGKSAAVSSDPANKKAIKKRRCKVIKKGAILFLLVTIIGLSITLSFRDAQAAQGQVKKKGVLLDIRSLGRQIGDEVAAFGNLAVGNELSPVPSLPVVPQIQFRGGNVQGNDADLDNIQIFTGFRPFVKFTQSETSVAAFGRNIVAVYNSSANQPLIPNPSGPGLIYTHRFLSGLSTSNDGGQTWTSGFMPPVSGSIYTYGDPVAGVDRNGIFYFAGLGADAQGKFTIQVNKSTDGGRTWSDAVIVQQDDGGDKEWLAIGPDPFDPTRDNLYVTWTSFQGPEDNPTSSQLRFGRSTDGGATWETKTIFAPPPDANRAMPQNFIQFSNPYVDRLTGRLYVPFLQYSNADQDFIKILVSDDAGETFSFLKFNIPGAIITDGLPVVQAGELVDCFSGGVRLAVHSGPDQGGGFPLRSFQHSSRLVTQPAFAARNGILYLAWAQSTSQTFGDPNSQSNVMFMRSDDDGVTWTSPIRVNPSVNTDTQHVLPFLSIDKDPQDVHILYYTQHSDETLDVDLANSHDRGKTFPANRTLRVSATSFALAPTNIKLPGNTSTNYDRTIAPGYCLGEYLSVNSANGTVYALWGDTRNSVTEPVDPSDPLSGQTHPQEDVFFQKVKAQ
jgi:hypothetical protein